MPSLSIVQKTAICFLDITIERESTEAVQLSHFSISGFAPLVVSSITYTVIINNFKVVKDRIRNDKE